MLYTVDRIENGVAVLVGDDGSILNVLITSLLHDAKEGDVFESPDGKGFIYSKDKTSERKLAAVNLHKSLFNKAKKKNG